MTMTFSTDHDRSDMRSDLLAWPGMLVRGWDQGRAAARPHRSDFVPRNVIWAGMGGSAIGGDFLAALLADQASFPVQVHRGGPLPAWVGKKDLIVLVSYSGNTAETLDTAAQALTRGCRVVALTSGGQLASLASEEGLEHWQVTGGKMPRAMLAELFATALGAFVEHGWVDVLGIDFDETVQQLDKLTDQLSEAPTSDHHPLGSLVDDLSDRHGMIYGSGLLVPAARRWACQLNENSKRAAQWGQMPEMNHNEVVPWDEGSDQGKWYTVVILTDPDAPADVLKRIPITEDLARAAGLAVHRIMPAATTALGRLLEVAVIGDWASYWLALGLGVDPTPIAPINTLKARLEE